MKKIYLVRHGETEANAGRLFQGNDQPLNAAGETQARRVAARLAHIKFDALIASDYTRAQQTAEEISKVSGVPIATSHLFRELDPPARFFGTSWDNNGEYQAISKELHEHFSDPDWHFEDMENYVERIARAKDALAFLASHEADSTLVVTHGTFLKFLLCVMIFGDAITCDIWNAWKVVFSPDNTGVTLLEYNDGDWKIRVLNDREHFAE